MTVYKFVKNFIERYNNISIKRMIFILSIVSISVPLVTLGIYANIVSRQAIIEKSRNSSMRELSLVGRNLDTLVNDFEDYSRILSTDYKLQQQLEIGKDMKDNPISKIDINSVLSEVISNIVTPNTRVAAASILDLKGDFYNVGSANNESAYTLVDSGFISYADKKKTPVWSELFNLKYYDSGISENVFAVAKAIISKKTGSVLGTACIYIKEKTIESIYMGNTNNTRNKFYIVNSMGQIISSHDKNDLYSTIDTQISNFNMEKFKNGSAITNQNGVKVLISVYSYTKLNWTIINIVPLNEITVENEKINKLIAISGIIFFLLSFLASYGLSRTISTPIMRLVSIMKEVKHGNLKLRTNFKDKNEIGILGEGFNNMMDTIDELVQKIHDEQKAKREFEFKLLQSQINPHFLYNSIETIVSLITLGMNKEASFTAQNLAGFYRISLSKGRDIITVGEELKLIDSYLLIQKYRYVDYMDYFIDFREEILGYKIPKLTLQPIVENSIYHGLKSKPEKGYINIKGNITEEKLVFEVFDNGVGMSDEQVLYALGHFDDSGKDNSFGLGNVDSRIKLIYGNDYGLKIESEIGKYTKVIIELPLVQ